MPESRPKQSTSRRAPIEVGNVVQHGGGKYQIKEVVDLSTVTVIDRETLKTKVLPLAELQIVKQAPEGVHIRALDELTEEEEKIAKKRLEAIQPLLEKTTIRTQGRGGACGRDGQESRNALSLDQTIHGL